jgi:nicotinate-nucleotide pyrophosphorylase (carboxylating)
MRTRLPAIHKDPAVRTLIRAALHEDVGPGDVTTASLVSSSARTRAVILTRKACVVSGAEIARAVFRQADPRIACRILKHDGTHADRNEVLMAISGPAASILTAERTALNFFQQMTGVATLTSRYVEKVKGLNVAILDTRKTYPLLRMLQKYAVLCGGGTNHRFGLYDRVLIKDNHRFLWGGGRLDKAIRAARAMYPRLDIEVEVENLDELMVALQGQPDWVLLDNMEPAELKQCVRACRGICLTEASGSITLANLRRVARTGVDAVSIGALTHSAPAMDLSLEFV